MRPARERPTAAGSVVRAVLELRAASRSVIARHAGLSPATVTSQTRALIEAGLLIESPERDRSHRVGRPHAPVELDRRNAVAAIHFAATKTRVAVLDTAGTTIASTVVGHRTIEGPGLVADAGAALTELRRELPTDTRLFGVGIATGGWVDSQAGVVLSHSLLHLHDTPIRDLIAQMTGLPAELDSHARAMVHAEQLFGVLDFGSSAALLFVGNVIDAAFAVDGRVHYGPGSSAGSLATLVSSGPAGLDETLEYYSDRALTRRAATSGLVTEPTMPALLAAAETNEAARALFEQRGRGLAAVAATLLDVLNPETLIITDRAFTSLPTVRAAYLDAIAERSQVSFTGRHRITGTSFPGRSLETAAAAVLLHRLFEDPLALAEQFAAPPAPAQPYRLSSRGNFN